MTTTKLGPLDQYGMSTERGFLSLFDAEMIQLPPALKAAEDAAALLPDYLVTGRVRELLERLPVYPMDVVFSGADDATLRTAFVRYSFMAQAYVWGEPEAPARLPECLAVPLWWLAEKTGQKPLLTYASYVLDNWGRLDPDRPIDLDNIFMIQNFLAGQDEAWFVLVHVAIEARAGSALGLFADIIDAADRRDAATMLKLLQAMDPIWRDVCGIFDRMPERCDPYVYFHRVRPYIHGWQDNPALPDGLIYEGVEGLGDAPQSFRGQTGSQSSIVPAMDALLGLGHEDDPLRRYLDELHAYRPPSHRAFIDATRESSVLREAVIEVNDPELKAAYNKIVSHVAAFRTKHLEYAASYINKQSGGAAGNDSAVGTGGTPFMRYLKKHRDESSDQLLD